jgi:hypothetical protein
MNHLFLMLGVFFTVSLSYISGYTTAHVEVATECQKLNSFYVGKSVFKCVEMPKKDSALAK